MQRRKKFRKKTALLPDYGFKNSDSTFGTSFSGIAGSAVVLIVCVGACYAFRFFKKEKVISCTEQEKNE